ncbi:hypothetical protein [uncultured Arcobacter sp.]|uniref:hypothetical protein n=1 Tax=uncultured Arcobacter sp. TaxID=165434 RepID=UPI00262EBF26|nr:hypothetical protein [uncultured Arcobacter sp.]
MNVSMDKKYRTRAGDEVKLLCNNGTKTYPFIGIIKRKGEEFFEEEPFAWGNDGSCLNDCSHPEFDKTLVEVSPYEDWKIDDKIEVSDDGIKWRKRHFAGINGNGNPIAWADGTTSWSASDSYSWKYARKG